MKPKNAETKKATVLVVDDVPSNVMILLETLSQAGYQVLVAQNGKQAIRTADYAHPDLILLDIMMPGIDGFETCRRLKAQPGTEDIPVLFMTALTDTVDKLKGFELGAADYITKPLQHREVLARIHAHLSVYKLQKQLLQRNMELEAFARTVAHNLKDPLNSVMNLASIVEIECQQESNDKALDRLNWMNRAIRQTLDIVDAILLLANLARHGEVTFEPLDMQVIVQETLYNRLPELINNYQAQIIQPEQWPTVIGYAPWVQEIWANYISNGLKYGGEPPCLELGVEAQNDGKVKFWVKDNGPGLSEEAKEQLFTPFIRLHKNRADGHGLGLSIVRQIADKLHGEVGVESDLSQGSLFYFTLPAA